MAGPQTHNLFLATPPGLLKIRFPARLYSVERDCCAIGNEGQYSGGCQIEKGCLGKATATFDVGVVHLPRFLLPLPLRDRQRLAARALDGWHDELFFGPRSDNGVHASRDDKGQQQHSRVKELGRLQDRLSGAGALLRTVVVGRRVHAATWEGSRTC